MNDDICFITDAISIVSKLKQPSIFSNHEHSFSKIIREQALNYDEEYFQLEWKIKQGSNKQIKMNKTDQKVKSHSDSFTNLEYKAINHPNDTHKKSSKLEGIRQRIQKRKKQSINDNVNINSIEKRGNFLIFSDNDNDNKNSNNSKKQKRIQKMLLFQQKTKKIQFQDCDRYKINIKKEQLTKIKRIKDYQQQNQLNLDIQSKSNSDLLNNNDINLISNKIIINYKEIIIQIKQQISIIKYQYLQAEKIDIRKFISKLQADIRRTKIGLRGLSDFNKNSNPSKLSGSKLQPNRENTAKKKGEYFTNKVESKLVMKMKNTYDYGLDSQIQSEKQQNLFEQIGRLQQKIRKQQIRQNKYTIKLNDLDKKLSRIQENIDIKQQLIKKFENNNKNILNNKKYKLLKQKQIFLKNEIKQSKLLFNNKIKRLKNQIDLLKNQNQSIQKNTNQNIQYKYKQNNNKKQYKQIISNKHNLIIFDQFDNKNNYNNNAPSLSNSNKQLTTNLGSINDAKSLKSLNSARSLASSKPSIGSLNSYKSTKIQSNEKRKIPQSQTPTKKLKINSPHHLSPPPILDNQNSIMKRFNISRQIDGNTLTKKSTSLDIALKQLHQKYSKHLPKNNTDQYYQNY